MYVGRYAGMYISLGGAWGGVGTRDTGPYIQYITLYNVVSIDTISNNFDNFMFFVIRKSEGDHHHYVY